MIAEISIGESKHDAVAKHIQSVRTPFLGNASPLTFNALCGNPRGDGQSRVGQTIDSKRRVIRVGPVHVKFPDAHCIRAQRRRIYPGVYFSEIIRGVSWRRGAIDR